MTVIESPLSVVCSPTSWSGVSRPLTTWWVSTVVSRGTSASSAGSASGPSPSKAALEGASTVTSVRVLSTSTRLAASTAWVSVLSCGTALIAPPTGTPATLPGPSGAKTSQPGPNGPTGTAADGDPLAAALSGALLGAAVVSPSSSELQELSAASRTGTAASTARRAVAEDSRGAFTLVSSCSGRLPDGGAAAVPGSGTGRRAWHPPRRARLAA